VRDQ